jgi:hypothetical protein
MHTGLIQLDSGVDDATLLRLTGKNYDWRVDESQFFNGGGA